MENNSYEYIAMMHTYVYNGQFYAACKYFNHLKDDIVLDKSLLEIFEAYIKYNADKASVTDLPDISA